MKNSKHAEFVYPAVFLANDDGSYTITYPDLQGCVSEGKNLPDAMRMAQSALTQWLEYLSEKSQAIPEASYVKDVKAGDGEFVSVIRAELKDGRAVKRTVSLPKWLDEKATSQGLSLSRVLQEALSQRLR